MNVSHPVTTVAGQVQKTWRAGLPLSCNRVIPHDRCMLAAGRIPEASFEIIHDARGCTSAMEQEADSSAELSEWLVCRLGRQQA